MKAKQFKKKWDRTPLEVYDHFLTEMSARKLLADFGAVDGVEIVQDLKEHFVLSDTADGYMKAAYLLKLQKEFQRAMNDYTK